MRLKLIQNIENKLSSNTLPLNFQHEQTAVIYYAIHL
jgi:hypothetical protein